MTYRPDAAARATTLQVHQISEGRATVYAGMIPVSATGRITATDATASVLARWPTAR